MKKTQLYLLGLLLILCLLAISSLSFAPGRVLDIDSAGPCNDPINRCRRPVYIGNNGNCSCFTCEDSSVACTDKDKDKLELFESEAKQRNTADVFEKLPAAQKNRLLDLGIGSSYKDNENPIRRPEESRNANRPSSMNANIDSPKTRPNLNPNRLPNVNQKPSPEP